jgi:hypothetical protein
MRFVLRVGAEGEPAGRVALGCSATRGAFEAPLRLHVAWTGLGLPLVFRLVHFRSRPLALVSLPQNVGCSTARTAGAAPLLPGPRSRAGRPIHLMPTQADSGGLLIGS